MQEIEGEIIQQRLVLSCYNSGTKKIFSALLGDRLRCPQYIHQEGYSKNGILSPLAHPPFYPLLWNSHMDKVSCLCKCLHQLTFNMARCELF